MSIKNSLTAVALSAAVALPSWQALAKSKGSDKNIKSTRWNAMHVLDNKAVAYFEPWTWGLETLMVWKIPKLSPEEKEEKNLVMDEYILKKKWDEWHKLFIPIDFELSILPNLRSKQIKRLLLETMVNKDQIETELLRRLEISWLLKKQDIQKIRIRWNIDWQIKSLWWFDFTALDIFLNPALVKKADERWLDTVFERDLILTIQKTKEDWSPNKYKITDMEFSFKNAFNPFIDSNELEKWLLWDETENIVANLMYQINSITEPQDQDDDWEESENVETDPALIQSRLKALEPSVIELLHEHWNNEFAMRFALDYYETYYPNLNKWSKVLKECMDTWMCKDVLDEKVLFWVWNQLISNWEKSFDLVWVRIIARAFSKNLIDFIKNEQRFAKTSKEREKMQRLIARIKNLR